jgi:hypothetical protein
MKKVFSYLRDYIAFVNKPIFFICTGLLAAGIYINYFGELRRFIHNLPDGPQYVAWYGIFFAAFSIPYFLQAAWDRSSPFRDWRFLLLLVLAPAIFAWKVAFGLHFHFSDNPYTNEYWNYVIYWPLKLLAVAAILFLIWKLTKNGPTFYGATLEGFRVKPYLVMLLIMIPLIAAASTQPDFLAVYPKFQKVYFLEGAGKGWYKALYELSYGTDFISIELFFRGFLVLAFVKWWGKGAILPMAMFYCTIHFGKPLGECISSFFGGLLLGTLSYHTRTIFGGLMVHLGIAWLMELGGYWGGIR